MDNNIKGWIYGFLGVAIFSGSLPATRLAVMDLSAYYITSVRGLVAGLIALILLLLLKQRAPRGNQWWSLVSISVGVVLGFPLLTALALHHMDSAHSIVFLGLLPLSTAIIGALRSHQYPRTAFWLFAFMGSLCVMIFAFSSDIISEWRGDLYMVAAVIVCAWGYSEGGLLSKSLGGWQVICWALVVAIPFMLVTTILTWPPHLNGIAISAWLGVVYVTLFSMLIGFFFWYHGLSLGGIASVSQLQLLQPFMALGLAAILLKEPITTGMLIATLGTILSLIGTKRFG